LEGGPGRPTVQLKRGLFREKEALRGRSPKERFGISGKKIKREKEDHHHNFWGSLEKKTQQGVERIPLLYEKN